MLHEYALDPCLLSGWSDFRFFVNQFGFDKGRLIARFPNKKWKKMVFNNLQNCQPIEKQKIVEVLSRIDDRMTPRAAIDWDPEYDWLQNAEHEHTHRPFRAIIAESNIRNHPSVILGVDVDDTIDYDELPESDARRLWQAERSKIIKRTAAEMADAIDFFMKRAESILFVDKHFGPENTRHRIPFEEFLSRLGERNSAGMPMLVAFHCSAKADVSFFQSQCQDRLASLVPEKLKLEFHRWNGDDLHNRFVLTELGGVAFLEGLDHYDGKGRKEDVVVLLDKNNARQLIENYTLGKTRFRHIDEFEVVGTRKL